MMPAVEPAAPVIFIVALNLKKDPDYNAADPPRSNLRRPKKDRGKRKGGRHPIERRHPREGAADTG